MSNGEDGNDVTTPNNEANGNTDGDDNEEVIYIENGRHPLQELILDNDNEFIPNDTHMDGNRHRMNVITGPNFSGKSCYTRQVGVLVYMAHLGCFLP